MISQMHSGEARIEPQSSPLSPCFAHSNVFCDTLDVPNVIMIYTRKRDGSGIEENVELINMLYFAGKLSL